MVAEATVEGPPRRRTSWSLKSIVEDVAGRPIGELQDPERPVHPYLRGKVDSLPPLSNVRSLASEPEPAYDPVGHVYPPLTGAAGRAYHGPEHEHHRETLDRHQVPPTEAAAAHRGPGPSHRPERLYLHYLLLHVDRLSDSGLHYLWRAVEEEIAHRERSGADPPAPSAPRE